jgi:ribosomal protein S4
MYRIQIKRSRRLFRNVWLVKKRTKRQKRLHRKIQRNTYRRRASEYFLKLRAKQYMSHFYGHINWKAIYRRVPGAPILAAFFHALETRLDVILYRMKVSPNLSVIKQLISHKKVLVNDQVVSVRNFYVKPGDIISVQPQTAIALQKSLFQKQSKRYWRRRRSIRLYFNHKAPHLEVNFKTMSAVLCTKPRFVRLPYVDDYKKIRFF